MLSWMVLVCGFGAIIVGGIGSFAGSFECKIASLVLLGLMVVFMSLTATRKGN